MPFEDLKSVIATTSQLSQIPITNPIKTKKSALEYIVENWDQALEVMAEVQSKKNSRWKFLETSTIKRETYLYIYEDIFL